MGGDWDTVFRYFGGTVFRYFNVSEVRVRRSEVGDHGSVIGSVFQISEAGVSVVSGTLIGQEARGKRAP